MDGVRLRMLAVSQAEVDAPATWTRADRPLSRAPMPIVLWLAVASTWDAPSARAATQGFAAGLDRPAAGLLPAAGGGRPQSQRCPPSTTRWPAPPPEFDRHRRWQRHLDRHHGRLQFSEQLARTARWTPQPAPIMDWTTISHNAAKLAAVAASSGRLHRRPAGEKGILLLTTPA